MAELGAALGDDARADREHGEADRHVDSEDPTPPETLSQQAAEQRARRAADAADRAPRAKRAVALSALRERGREDREARGRDDRAADALDGARSDQPRGGGCERARKRRGGEEKDAHEQDSPAPEQVGCAPAEHQQAGEGQRVGVDYPLQALGREVQGSLDRRQRDVHDRDVEDHHELGDADQDEQQRRVGARLDERGVHRRASSMYAAVTIASRRLSLIRGGVEVPCIWRYPPA